MSTWTLVKALLYKDIIDFGITVALILLVIAAAVVLHRNDRPPQP